MNLHRRDIGYSHIGPVTKTITIANTYILSIHYVPGIVLNALLLNEFNFYRNPTRYYNYNILTLKVTLMLTWFSEDTQPYRA